MGTQFMEMNNLELAEVLKALTNVKNRPGTSWDFSTPEHDYMHLSEEDIDRMIKTIRETMDNL